MAHEYLVSLTAPTIGAAQTLLQVAGLPHTGDRYEGSLGYSLTVLSVSVPAANTVVFGLYRTAAPDASAGAGDVAGLASVSPTFPGTVVVGPTVVTDPDPVAVFSHSMDASQLGSISVLAGQALVLKAVSGTAASPTTLGLLVRAV